MAGSVQGDIGTTDLNKKKNHALSHSYTLYIQEWNFMAINRYHFKLVWHGH